MSTSTARNGVKKNSYSCKKPTARVVKDGLYDARKLFAIQMKTKYKPDDIISIDESAFYFQLLPLKGYSKKGRRLEMAKHSHQRHRVTLLMAVGTSGLISYKLYKDSMNSSRFADFIRQCLKHTGKTCLLMDNAAFHKTSEVMVACNDVCIKPIFLPPYSPEFQPIEHAFAICKHHYRRTVPSVAFNPADFNDRIHYNIAKCSPQSMHNIFEAVWRRYIDWSEAI